MESLREAGATLLWLGLRDLHAVRNQQQWLINAKAKRPAKPDTFDP